MCYGACAITGYTSAKRVAASSSDACAIEARNTCVSQWTTYGSATAENFPATERVPVDGTEGG